MRPAPALRSKLILAFAASAGALTLVGALALRTGAQVPAAARWVAHTGEVIEAVSRLRADIDAVQGAHRDFLLTGDRARKAAYEGAKPGLEPALEDLVDLTRDDPRQQQRLANLGAAISDWLRASDAALASRPPSAARVLEQRRATSRLRDLLASVRAEESRLLAQRVSQNRERAQRALWLTLVGVVGAIAVVVISAALVLHDLDRRLALERLRLEVSHHVNHELRNPITSVVMALRLLEETSAVSDGDGRKILGIALSSSKHLQRMVDDLLDVTRSETGKLRVEIQRVALTPLIEDCAASARALASSRGIALETRVEAELAAKADAVRVRQILTNLIDNALKFTPEGGRVVVEARALAGGASVEVGVADTGSGIPKDALEKIFDRLYQTERGAASSEKGLGLGLAICRELVERQNGRIWAESEPGRGARLAFTLPAA